MASHRIVVLGASASGKSSLLSRFLYGNFFDKYIPTLEDLHGRVIQLPNGIFKHVEFLDTSGSTDFPAMRDLCIQSGDGFLIVYSVDDTSSFEEAQNIHKHIVSIRGPDKPISFVGNKIDLTGSRRVRTEDGMHLAKSKNASFTETTAKCNLNVKCAIDTILQFVVCGSLKLKNKRNTLRRLHNRKWFKSLPRAI